MDIQEQLESAGWSLSVETVNSGGYKVSAEYRVTVHRDNSKVSAYRGPGQSYTTDYTSGWGNRVWAKQPYSVGCKWDRYDRKRGERANVASNWKAVAECEPSQQAHQTKQLAEFAQITEPILPTLPDVMFSLVMDAQCVFDGQTFDDFCGDFGYDNDSRSAERIFQACRDTWCALIRLGADFDGLSELFQDY